MRLSQLPKVSERCEAILWVGLAAYAEWTTSPDEWALFRRVWLYLVQSEQYCVLDRVAPAGRVRYGRRD
jgi:hypothetical protein